MNTAKKYCTLVFMMCLAAAEACASAVSIQVVQHDGISQDVRSSSYLIEDTLMDYFFETGHIASTVPAAPSGGSDADRKLEKRALEEAEDGFCAYLIMVYADYDTSQSRNPSADLLSNLSSVSWKIIDLSDRSTVSTGSRKPPREQSSKDIVTFVRELAADFAAFVR